MDFDFWTLKLAIVRDNAGLRAERVREFLEESGVDVVCLPPPLFGQEYGRGTLSDRGQTLC